MNLQIEIGKRVRSLRKGLDFTLQELSDRSGMSVSFLGEIEHGRRIPSIETAAKLARSLNVSLPEIFSFENDSSQIRNEIADLLSSRSSVEQKCLLKLLKSGIELLKTK